MRFEDRLLSHSEAKDWNGAYPLGNGIMGAMIDGGVAHEALYLNDGGFWAGSGEPTFRANDVFPKVKEDVMLGNIGEAEHTLWKSVYGEYAESYLPLCSLHIDRNILNDDTYTRLLDISKAVHTISCVPLNECCFASHEDGVLVLRDEISRDVVTTLRVKSDVKHETLAYPCDGGGILAVNELAPSHMDPVGHPQAEPVIYDATKMGIRAYIMAKVLTDGEVTAGEDGLTISGATHITLIMADSLSTRSDDMVTSVRDTLDKAESIGYDDLLMRHIADYTSLYDRVHLSIGEGLDDSITTATALRKYSKHPSMSTLMFNYARYLMISASREDSNCMNLQGIWNADFKPPWSSAYTVNINIEMNYWIAESTNLSECHMPLFRQLKVLEKSGRRTAREQLHTAGWCCGHNSDLWGHSNLTGRISTFDPSMYAMFISGGAWLATHIYTHYAYTHDVEFLREYYYILRGVAEFYLDYAVKDNESEYMVLCPGSSPENTYILNGERHTISKNTTMDSSIARHIMRIILDLGDIVGEDEAFLSRCEDLLTRIYPYKICKNGCLQEWYGDYRETEKTHRHISHLYGLYPDNQIDIDRTPALAEASYKTIRRRGKKGIGWSLAWKVNMLARLRKGDEALKVIGQKLAYYDSKMAGLHYGGCYENLFSAPPMQIDGNFGIAAGIKEMLLQDTDIIRLLPALPKKWSSGSFSGLVVRGGYVVSLSWTDGLVTSLRVDGTGDKIEVVVNGSKRTIPLGEDIRI